MNRAFALVLGCACTVSVNAHGARSSWQKPPTPAGVTAHDVEYELDGQSYTGYVAYPSATPDAEAPLPGVLVAHQWMGLGAMEQFRAEDTASPLFLMTLLHEWRMIDHVGWQVCGHVWMNELDVYVYLG